MTTQVIQGQMVVGKARQPEKTALPIMYYFSTIYLVLLLGYLRKTIDHSTISILKTK